MSSKVSVIMGMQMLEEDMVKQEISSREAVLFLWSVVIKNQVVFGSDFNYDRAGVEMEDGVDVSWIV